MCGLITRVEIQLYRHVYGYFIEYLACISSYERFRIPKIKKMIRIIQSIHFPSVQIAPKSDENKTKGYIQNLISSEDDHDTSACKIADYSHRMFFGQYLETQNGTRFSESQSHQKGRKSTAHDHNLINSYDDQDTSASQISNHPFIPNQTILLMQFPGKEMSRNLSGQTKTLKNCLGWSDGKWAHVQVGRLYYS